MQTLLLSDYSKIKPYLELANYEGYNSNFVTMMMWNHEYHITYEIHDHFLIMLHNYKNTRFFAMPFCAKEYYQEAISYMIQYAREHHFPFLMDSVTLETKEAIQECYGQQFMYQAIPYNDDYIYEKEMLETLRGKKMQKRRNHYNAFIKTYPNFLYKEIEEEDIDNVLACFQRWNAEHLHQESAQSEYIGIMYLLIHRKELSITTGCIYIDGVLEAFIIGSKLARKTIQIHVEKANKDIRGLYVAICKHFLENNYEGQTLVNREEDMGIPSLRKAKKALQPIKMIHKYRITDKQFAIRKAREEDTERILTLWKQCFVDEDEVTTTFYFSTCYQQVHTYVLTQSNTIVTVLQMIPYLLDNEEVVYFVLGVCTDPDFQGNGCMKVLLQQVLQSVPYASSRIFLQAYNPDIYRKFGFRETYFQNKTKVDVLAYSKDTTIYSQPIAAKEQLALYQTFCRSFTGYRKRDIQYYTTYLQERCLAFKDTILGIFKESQLLGYVIYHESSLEITISEIIYISKEALNDIVRFFANQEKELTIFYDMKASIIGETSKVCTMMTNDVTKKEIDTNLYINEVY